LDDTSDPVSHVSVADARRGAILAGVPLFICPGCGRRTAGDRHVGHQPRGCQTCGFGFVFEILDDYYPGPKTALIACDGAGVILAGGRGAGAVTGYRDPELIGTEIRDRLGLEFAGEDPIARSLEWGVRALAVPCRFRPNGLSELRSATLDVFPGYDDDGGVLVAITPA